MKRAGTLARAGLIAGVVLPLLACGNDAGGELTIRVGLSPTPPLVGDARVIVHVVDGDGVPVEGATVEISATPASTTDRPTPTVASEQGGGRYIVPAFPFARAGEWTLRSTVLTADGRAVEREEAIRVSGPPR